MRRTLLAVWIVGVMFACGDSSPGVDAGSPPDASADAAATDAAEPDAPPTDAAPPDAPPPDAAPPDAAPPDAAPPDAAPPDATVITVDSVTTVDGSRQLRQGAHLEIIVRGAGLAGATAVTAAGVTIDILTTSGAEIRAMAGVDRAHPPGPLDVTVTAPAGSATLPGALDITNVIVSPTGVVGARGTYDSPFTLCDPALSDVASGGGSTFELLAGAHDCDHPLRVTDGNVVGAGSAATIVRAPLVMIGAPPRVWPRVEGLTVRTADVAIRLSGHLRIADVAIEDAAVGLLLEANPWGFELTSVCELNGFAYRGPGTALDAGDRHRAELRDSVITRTASGGPACVIMGWGHVGLSYTTIEGCPIAVDVQGGSPAPDPPGGATLDDCTLLDNEVGVAIGRVQAVSLLRTTVRDREDTAAPATTGVLVRSARLEINDSDIIGYGVGIEGHGASTYVSRVTVTASVIDAEQTAITMEASTPSHLAQVFLYDATIRSGGTGMYLDGAAYSEVYSTAIVSGTGFALDLGSPGVFYEFRALGTLLNGHSYGGRVQGPAEAGRDYRLRDASSLLFDF